MSYIHYRCAYKRVWVLFSLGWNFNIPRWIGFILKVPVIIFNSRRDDLLFMVFFFRWLYLFCLILLSSSKWRWLCTWRFKPIRLSFACDWRNRGYFLLHYRTYSFWDWIFVYRHNGCATRSCGICIWHHWLLVIRYIDATINVFLDYQKIAYNVQHCFKLLSFSVPLH